MDERIVSSSMKDFYEEVFINNTLARSLGKSLKQ
jgi:hypothetical protein